MEDNWGTVIFLIFYLSVIWAYLFVILVNEIKKKTLKNRDSIWNWIFIAYFLLAFGDIFHLGSRIYIFFAGLEYDSVDALILIGWGFIATNITMTYFYVAILHAWINMYGKQYSTPKNIKIYLALVYSAFFIRIPLVFLPYNNWFLVDAPLELGYNFRIIPAIPLYIIGFITVGLLFKDSRAEKKKPTTLNPEWNLANYNASIWYIISFITFSITNFLGAYIPIMGMCMIPKTVAYLIALYYHYKYILSK